MLVLKNKWTMCPHGTHSTPSEKNFQRPCPPPSPRATKLLEAQHRETLTLGFFALVLCFQFLEPSDRSLGTGDTYTENMVDHPQPCRTFPQVSEA
jgi:hypothetical protein